MLESRGYAVALAIDPEGAYAKADELGDSIAAIVCDLVMPVLDGPSLIDALRARGVTAPVVFVSGYASERLRDTLAGRPLLAKPFTLAQLVAELERIVARSPASPAGVASARDAADPLGSG
jgi:CheY-like chemotaxis protein